MQKQIITIGGICDRRAKLVGSTVEMIEFPVAIDNPVDLTQPDAPFRVAFNRIIYRATDLYFDGAQVFIPECESQYDLLSRALTAYLRNGGK